MIHTCSELEKPFAGVATLTVEDKIGRAPTCGGAPQRGATMLIRHHFLRPTPTPSRNCEGDWQVVILSELRDQNPESSR